MKLDDGTFARVKCTPTVCRTFVLWKAILIILRNMTENMQTMNEKLHSRLEIEKKKEKIYHNINQ